MNLDNAKLESIQNIIKNIHCIYTWINDRTMTILIFMMIFIHVIFLSVIVLYCLPRV